MKRIIILLLFVLMFSAPVHADLYGEQYEQSGAGSLYDALPNDVKDFFDGLPVNSANSDWVNSLKTENVFKMIWESLKTNGKTPLVTAASIVGMLLLCSALAPFFDGQAMNTVMAYTTSAVTAGTVLLPVYGAITSVVNTVKVGAQFMISFVPVYCTVLTAAGKPTTAAASGSLLLAANETVVLLSSSIIVPTVGAYLAVCICGTLTPIAKTEKIAELMKKVANWTIGLIMTVYIGILGIQTTVNSAADSLAVKTGKFMIGSFVPVVGAPISEALTTVKACVSLLKSSVGIYGVVATALILLPAVAQLFMWRLSLLLSSAAAELLSSGKTAALLKAADSTVSLLMGILLICSVAFIISLTILTAVGI